MNIQIDIPLQNILRSSKNYCTDRCCLRGLGGWVGAGVKPRVLKGQVQDQGMKGFSVIQSL